MRRAVNVPKYHVKGSGRARGETGRRGEAERKARKSDTTKHRTP